MTIELEEDVLLQVIEDALKLATNSSSLSQPVTLNSTMGSPKEWDSLSFVTVFTAVSEAFSIELDNDDAIHFLSVSTMHEFLNEILSE